MVMTPQRLKVPDRYVRHRLRDDVREPTPTAETAGAGPARTRRQEAGKPSEQPAPGLGIHFGVAGQTTDQLPDLGGKIGSLIIVVAAASDVL
jgi:hypothetical protein